MIKQINDILEKTYSNPILRRTTIPTFFSSPGGGKSSTIAKFAESKGVNMVKITLSTRMPNEVVGMLMPDTNSGKMVAFNSLELSNLKPGDIIFFDECFNGTVPATLYALLNFLEDRRFPNGEPCPDCMIVAASNPEGLIHLTPQIKERFIRYDLKFNAEEFQDYLLNKYAMLTNISKNVAILVNKEKFDSEHWAYYSPRSIEKALQQIGCDVQSTLDELLLPILKTEIECPKELVENARIKKGEKVEYLTILKLIIKEMNNPGSTKLPPEKVKATRKPRAKKVDKVEELVA